MKSGFDFPILIKASTTIRKSAFVGLEAERVRELFQRAFEPHSFGEIQTIYNDAFAFNGAPFKIAWSKWNCLSDFSYGEVKILEKDDRWVISFIGNPRRILTVAGIYALGLSGLWMVSSMDVRFSLLFGLGFSSFNALLSFLTSRYRMKRFLDKTRLRMMLDR